MNPAYLVGTAIFLAAFGRAFLTESGLWVGIGRTLMGLFGPFGS